MFRTTLALVLALSSPALATQEYILPTLFDVSGVAANDVLNIRAEPDAKAAIIGTLARDAKAIEVVEEREGWGRVNTAGQSGWVSMRYLSYRTDVWQPDAVPAAFRCLGTEPFWDAKREGGDLVLRTPEDQAGDRRPVQAVLDTGVFRDPSRVVVARDMTLFAHPQICSDGMSDRLFGLSATLVIHGDSPRMLSGCCTIQP
ncbi:SH3 domain-containing protein [Paracoccus sp. YIM 132242]|uniref:SH3 domain-containing protein n=1 Tax=Paracoccus lichenicola TaxID=2665644 RepID=A0A6L6HNF1_9RHOB|nr:SH3 domain-containing protein [Paracoccus lichenicola]MTE00676.1 SH3 domain-containing protein [Paracoccus lichenicola]